MTSRAAGRENALLLGAAAALLAAACAPSAMTGGFDSPNPAARLYAIERAARAGDESAIPQLVEQLDSDDPAVRMLAIAALERLTGRTMQYRHDDPVIERRLAIQRWVKAVQQGTVGLTVTTSSTGRHDNG